ncbi:LytR/AlgR family response regulator transcription factor [Aurantiacibacter gangjinensis]|uniref:LytTR family transcriptional regulator n=1 Tax=Aurantiacibacter gangjinensis TaxID=502682 RepID=A0A0G9MLD7_9SPHN|nr:LytTR family DNA-binding domain-containing protein [Aurantiacibacter gangjinensis]APE27492.1 Two-component response regulator [Aurantiacibacter gangjinensis]KLE31551.1 LytTR family transcriptional regulator [Aurantiacibacter gangjinensis]
MTDSDAQTLRTLIVDDEPLAIERMQVLCAEIPQLTVVGTASEGDSALRLAEKLGPDLLLLDMTMPGKDGLQVAAEAGKLDPPPAVIFVTAHENFAVEAFDLEAIDYVLKPVAGDRLERAIERALARRESRQADGGADDRWLSEFWVPHRSELLRVDVAEVHRIDAERDYVRLHVGETSYLLLQTIAGLEEKLDPEKFIRIHRSTILRRDVIAGLKHEGLGVWCAELADGEALRIGRTYLKKVKAMAGR